MTDSPVLLRATRHVDMGDVDAARIIYYVSPLRWHEALFTEWLRMVDHPLSDILASGAATPCVEATIKYMAPLLLDDELSLTLHVDHIGQSSFVLRSRIDKPSRGNCVEVRAAYAWAEFGDKGPTGAKPLPDWLRGSLEAAN
jgi:YbgC/YbaW family acyl-CoA thioester hydrolase